MPVAVPGGEVLEEGRVCHLSQQDVQVFAGAGGGCGDRVGLLRILPRHNEVIAAGLEMLAEDIDDIAVTVEREHETRYTLQEVEADLRATVDSTWFRPGPS